MAAAIRLEVVLSSADYPCGGLLLGHLQMAPVEIPMDQLASYNINVRPDADCVHCFQVLSRAFHEGAYRGTWIAVHRCAYARHLPASLLVLTEPEDGG